MDRAKEAGLMRRDATRRRAPRVHFFAVRFRSPRIPVDAFVSTVLAARSRHHPDLPMKSLKADLR